MLLLTFTLASGIVIINRAKYILCLIYEHIITCSVVVIKKSLIYAHFLNFLYVMFIFYARGGL